MTNPTLQLARRILGTWQAEMKLGIPGLSRFPHRKRGMVYTFTLRMSEQVVYRFAVNTQTNTVADKDNFVRDQRMSALSGKES